MRHNKHSLLIALIGILFVLSSTGFMEFNNKTKSANMQYLEPIKTAESIPLIEINGNSELASHPNVTGSGTWADPYVIEDYEITGSGPGIGININNTDKPLIIQNCRVENFSKGIYIYNVSNVEMDNNTASDNGVGIELYYSDNNTLTINTALNNTNYGIWLYSSGNNTLIGNTVLDNDNSGIYLESSYNNTLTGNTASNNHDNGIYLSYSDNNTLTGNTASNNHNNGIYLSYSHNNMLTGNTVSNNWNGIDLSYSANNMLTGNTASFNGNGIVLWDSESNEIFNNIMISCGIWVQGNLAGLLSNKINQSNIVNGKP
ncbi:MAG TPA: NosD domain-containing protein, partial [Candidatus Nanopelagicaceae bacterium]|nr:NosD domain-containing protein [Candidatus Nanopelagicaceae bacterium]